MIEHKDWFGYWSDITDDLAENLEIIKFNNPVDTVYNPLIYARNGYDNFCKEYGLPPKKVVFIGMNPGPWGMVQTGIPFGSINIVKSWLKIDAEIFQPKKLHPNRPVYGFDCSRNEVSGQRLWSWAIERFKSKENFFKTFFVINYCPLAFFDEKGRNITPDKLKRKDRAALFSICDSALRKMINVLKPKYLVGIGNFAFKRLNEVFPEDNYLIGKVLHPSPANPSANKGWAELCNTALTKIGI